MRFVLISLIFALVCLPVYIAQADEETNAPLPPADYDKLKRTGAARIDQLIDGLTLTLKDGSVVRLAGIDIPGMGSGSAEAPLAAFHALQDLLAESTEITLYQTRSAKEGRENRMGQKLAHIEREKDKQWVQGILLSEGLARAMPSETNSEMIAQMLTLEQTARSAKKGIWADDSPYRLLTPEETFDKVGTMQVVEGTVLKTASVANNIYLNFGEDWRSDFTVRLLPNERKKLARSGLDPLSLTGQKIRVRGYIEEYNGPMITLETEAHLEIPVPEAAVDPTP